MEPMKLLRHDSLNLKTHEAVHVDDKAQGAQHKRLLKNQLHLAIHGSNEQSG